MITNNTSADHSSESRWKRRSQSTRILPPSGRKTSKNGTNLWAGVIPHLLSLPVPVWVSCSTERVQPVALSRFMGQIIIGNIRQLLGHKGRLERRGSRWREGKRWQWFENMRGGKKRKTIRSERKNNSNDERKTNTDRRLLVRTDV